MMKVFIYIFILALSTNTCTEFIEKEEKEPVHTGDANNGLSVEHLDVNSNPDSVPSMDSEWLDWYKDEKTGYLYITNFTLEDAIDNQNWSITQDNHNVMLFANRRGILSFDGIDWNVIRTPGFPYIIKKDPGSGIVFVGCNENFGYLIRDEKGIYRYISLSESIKNVGEVTNLVFTTRAVYFYSDKIITRISLNDFSDISQTGLEGFNIYNGIVRFKDKVFVNQSGTGLVEVFYDKKVPVSPDKDAEGQTEILQENRNEPDSLSPPAELTIRPREVVDTTGTGAVDPDTETDEFSNSDIVCSFPFDEEHVLIGTSDNMLFLFEGTHLKEYKIKDENYLEESMLYGGVNLSEKEFALSTLTGGCIVLSKDSGKTISTINYQTGLPDDEIYAIGADVNKGLWLSHEFGISRVNLSTPVKNYNSYPGLEGNLFSIIDFDTTVYVSSTEGVYYLAKVKDYKEIDTLIRVKKRVKEYKPIVIELEPDEPEEEVMPKVEKKQESEVVDKWENKYEKKKSWFDRWREKREARRKKLEEQEKVSIPEPQSTTAEVETAQSRQPRKIIKRKAVYKTKETVVSKKTYALQSIRYLFKKLEGIDEKCRHLVKYNDKLLVATNVGLYEVQDKEARSLVKGKYINCITQSLNPRRFFIGTNSGIFSIYFNPESEDWDIEYNFQDFNRSVYSIIECSNHVLWVGTENYAYRFSIDSRGLPLFSDEFNFKNEFSERILIQKVYDKPYFLLSSYIAVYDEETESIKTYGEFDYDVISKIKYIFPQEHLTWYKRQEDWQYLGDTIYPVEQKLKYLNLFDNIQNIYVDEYDNVWILDGKNSIYQILTSKKTLDEDHKFSIFIKGVSNNQGVRYPLSGVELGWEEYQDNSLSFQIAAPFFIKQEATQYQYFLDGLSNKWSNWTNSTMIEFPFGLLPSGNHKLQVRSKNIFGKVSSVKNYAFTIHPPYWQTTWFRLIVVFIFLLMGYTIFKIRERNHIKERKLLEMKVAERTAEIEKQQQEITDSIQYASRIQEAILPGEEILTSSGVDTFVLNMPREIVSGDYHWFAENGNSFIAAAADCTGHGVPGAFLSMLGITQLNEIVLNKNILQADEILNQLREQVITSLHQQGKQRESQDGMDIALCVIDKDNLTLQFAGANNPLYIIRDNELFQVKGDKMPISIYGKKTSRPFTNNEIQLEHGDRIYIFSDGYMDQFGGPNGRKFLAKRFRELLVRIHQKPMEEQKSILEKTIIDWMGDKPQIDDILVVGIKI
jgi:serine phosphatase RsbU (regulator of sigma subunit)